MSPRPTCDCQMGYWQGRCISCGAAEHIESKTVKAAKAVVVYTLLGVTLLVVSWYVAERLV